MKTTVIGEPLRMLLLTRFLSILGVFQVFQWGILSSSEELFLKDTSYVTGLLLAKSLIQRFPIVSAGLILLFLALLAGLAMGYEPDD